jgi:hypothetical protein
VWVGAAAWVVAWAGADEIRALKEQAKDLTGKIQEIERRISRLEKNG